ncbi:Serine/threonine-protein kinase AFC1 [Diplonema papillatum]|nr:Serine/threonine-protein kinase AFC1 [Diplonema papillatum]
MPVERRYAGSFSGGGILDSRYQLLSVAGKGHFATVFKARDNLSNCHVAVKTLSREYAEHARMEQIILRTVEEADKKRKKKVVHLLDAFIARDKYCLVLEMLGPALSSRTFGVASGAVSREGVALLARNMAEALTFIHGKCALVHTDIKPDNILLDALPTKPGLGPGFSLADFGNAAFQGASNGTSLITTRPYRSPEVVLQRGWRHATDLWSLGCVLFEVYTGKHLFSVHNDDAHIAAMTSKLGAIPGLSYQTAPPVATRYLEKHFPHDPEFLDLMRGLLTYNPAQRLRGKEMCKHRFVADQPPLPVSSATLVLNHVSHARSSVSEVSVSRHVDPSAKCARLKVRELPAKVFTGPFTADSFKELRSSRCHSSRSSPPASRVSHKPLAGHFCRSNTFGAGDRHRIVHVSA